MMNTLYIKVKDKKKSNYDCIYDDDDQTYMWRSLLSSLFELPSDLEGGGGGGGDGIEPEGGRGAGGDGVTELGIQGL